MPHFPFIIEYETKIVCYLTDNPPVFLEAPLGNQTNGIPKSLIFFLPIILVIMAVRIDAPVNKEFEEHSFLRPKLKITKPFTTRDFNNKEFCNVLTRATVKEKRQQKILDSEIAINERIRKAHLLERKLLKKKIERINRLRERIKNNKTP